MDQRSVDLAEAPHGGGAAARLVQGDVLLRLRNARAETDDELVRNRRRTDRRRRRGGRPRTQENEKEDRDERYETPDQIFGRDPRVQVITGSGIRAAASAAGFSHQNDPFPRCPIRRNGALMIHENPDVVQSTAPGSSMGVSARLGVASASLTAPPHWWKIPVNPRQGEPAGTHKEGEQHATDVYHVRHRRAEAGAVDGCRNRLVDR